MKKRESLYWTSLISITTAVVCIGFPWNVAMADDTPPAPTTPQAAPVAAAQAPALPYGVAEVVKMYQGGIGKDILVNYIDSNVLPYHLNADGIIYLQHLGMPQEVTSALLRRDGELQKQAGLAYQQQQQQPAMQAPNAQYAPAANSAPPVVMPSTPPPTAPYTYFPDATGPLAYPDYSYAYPYYGYPYYYGPNFVIGGFGWGWGGRGFAHGGFGGRGGFGGHGGGHR
jgi:hypothetical protein